MKLDYSEKKKVKIDMRDYVKGMLDSFPIKFKEGETATTPAAGEDLFGQKSSNDKKLQQDKAEAFHTTVAQGLFLTKRGRPDRHTGIAFLCTRVQQPNEEDWEKLMRLMKYMNGTKELVLNIMKWFVDAALAVHADFKSHTGMTMTMGQGTIMSMSRKQKLNTKSSTTAELVGADDATTMMLWTKLFMEEQGYKIEENVLYQDNKSAILLELSGIHFNQKNTLAFIPCWIFL